MNELLATAAVAVETPMAEETAVPIATVEETAAPVDLATVSQQLDQVLAWQGAQFGMLAVIFGCVLGVVFGKIIGRFWR